MNAELSQASLRASAVSRLLTSVARVVEQRHAHRVGALVGLARGSEVEARVVVLHVELPGDPAPLELVEDRRQAAVALSRYAVAMAPGGSRHPGEVVGHAATRCRGEEPVEQDELLG